MGSKVFSQHMGEAREGESQGVSKSKYFSDSGKLWETESFL